jgi:hypothetical protein
MGTLHVKYGQFVIRISGKRIYSALGKLSPGAFASQPAEQPD